MHIHTFIPSDKKDYEICTECGSYHSTNQTDPDELYVTNPYWDYDFHRSKIEEQVLNLQTLDEAPISKIDSVLQYIPDAKEGMKALEIACSPGTLLNRLSEKGYEAYGIEPSIRYIDFIKSQAPNAQVILGYFPQCISPTAENVFDVIVGCDIYEHIENGDTFIRSIHRLLKPGGVCVLMSPIIRHDGKFRERDMIPAEHAWIYTQKYLEPYLKEIFTKVEFGIWILGHEEIILTK